MSIKPIDFNVILPKTQELNSHRIVENVKHRNIVDSNYIQREKIVNQNQKKVLDTEKTEHSKITKDEKRKNKYEHQEKKRKRSRENPSSKKKTSFSGHKIDIQI
ncbi:MAG: hypothetical protein GX021_01610 [Tissierellia bacterium]|nr:hypothetical protein [Tissierellia bacterium]